MAIGPRGGRNARTSYRVLERMDLATLVEARLHTGRTHQIRVHFQHLGFPVAGDRVYGRRQTATLERTAGFVIPRQLLHAASLAFDHPVTGKRITCEAPLPQDFTFALRHLGA